MHNAGAALPIPSTRLCMACACFNAAAPSPCASLTVGAVQRLDLRSSHPHVLVALSRKGEPLDINAIASPL